MIGVVASIALLAASSLAASLRGDIPAATSIVDCGSLGLKFDGLNLFPTNPAKGSPANLYGNGTMTEAVSAGKIALAVELDGVTLYSTSCNLCGSSTISLPLGFGSVTIDGLGCPAASGDSEHIHLSLNLPSAVPSGTYNVSMVGTESSANSNVFCIDAQFPL